MCFTFGESAPVRVQKAPSIHTYQIGVMNGSQDLRVVAMIKVWLDSRNALISSSVSLTPIVVLSVIELIDGLALAAVDAVIRTGDEGRQGAGEVSDQLADILRCTIAYGGA